MDKGLILFLVKYFVLFAFLFLTFFVLDFSLKQLRSINENDKKYLQLLLYAGSFVAAGLMVYYGLNAIHFQYFEFFGIMFLALILAYWIFAKILLIYLLRLLIAFNQKLENGKIVIYNNNFYKFLDFYRDKALLEDLDGKVIQIPVKTLMNTDLSNFDDKIWFYSGSPQDIDALQEKIRNNPYIEPDLIAIIEEEDLATRQEKIKICIKGNVPFKDIKLLKEFLK